MRYKAILFDFDGVIGKTMEDNYNAWAYAFRSVGIQLDKTKYFLLEGLDARGVAKTILGKHSMSKSLAIKIVEIKEKHYLEHNSFMFYPGVLDLIEGIRSQFKLGLVSGATYKRLHRTVPPDFLGKFETIVTGDKVENPKPAPEPYLLASKNLNVDSSYCLVVENAPLGIESAKKANMECVAICSTLDRRYLSKADFIIENIVELRNCMNAINGNRL